MFYATILGMTLFFGSHVILVEDKCLIFFLRDVYKIEAYLKYNK